MNLKYSNLLSDIIIDHIYSGHTDTANAMLKAWRQHEPTDGYVVALGCMLHGAGYEPEPSVEAALAVTGIASECGLAFVMLHAAYAREGREPMALAALARARMLAPADPEVALHVAREAMRRGDRSSALQALELVPDDRIGSHRCEFLAIQLLVSGDEPEMDRAMAKVMAIKKRRPDLAHAWMVHAELLMMQGHFEEAEFQWQIASVLAPQDSRSLQGRAVALLAQSVPAKRRSAIELLTGILVKDGGAWEVRTRLIDALRADAQHEEAIHVLEEGLSRWPASQWHFLAAEIYFDADRPEEARRSLARARTGDSDPRLGDLWEIREAILDHDYNSALSRLSHNTTRTEILEIQEGSHLRFISPNLTDAIMYARYFGELARVWSFDVVVHGEQHFPLTLPGVRRPAPGARIIELALPRAFDLCGTAPHTPLFEGPYLSSLEQTNSVTRSVFVDLGASPSTELCEAVKLSLSGAMIDVFCTSPGMRISGCGSHVVDLENLDSAVKKIADADCVIAVDGVFSHLAGAMGKRTLALLGAQHDWWWGKQESTPLYPTVAISREDLREGWKPAAQAIRSFLGVLR